MSSELIALLVSTFMDLADDDDEVNYTANIVSVDDRVLSSSSSSTLLGAVVGFTGPVRRRQYEIHSGRVQGYHEETIPSYTPDSFRSHFRMSRQAFEVISLID